MTTQLTGALPELQQAEATLRSLAAGRGIVYTIAPFGAIRSEADTTRILGFRETDYATYLKSLPPGKTPLPIETFRPIAPFGSSMHNWGAAFDVKIITAPRGVDGLTVLGALAPQAGLRWGGTFSGTRRDPPHFELPITVSEARNRWMARGNSPGIDPQRGVALSALGLLLAVGLGWMILRSR